jgi:hypothetical protein
MKRNAAAPGSVTTRRRVEVLTVSQGLVLEIQNRRDLLGDRVAQDEIGGPVRMVDDTERQQLDEVLHEGRLFSR